MMAKRLAILALTMTMVLLSPFALESKAAVKTISQRTLWTFNDLTIGNLSTATSGANQDVNGEGLLYGGNSGSSIVELTSEVEFSEGTKASTSKVILLQSNTTDSWTKAESNPFASQRSGEDYNPTFNRALAINTETAGTLYVIYSRSGSVTTGRNFEIFFNYKNSENTWTYTSASKQIAKDQTEVNLHGETGGTYWIRVGQQSYIHAILFVPDGTTEPTTPQYTINASANPTAGGTISMTNPTGLTLPATVDEGTNITLSASANENYEFVKWTTTDSEEALSTEASYTVSNINADMNLIAHFQATTSIQTYSITLGDHSHGSLSVSPEQAAEGETVTVTAEPDNGYQLSSITITKTEDNAPYLKITNGTMTFTMPAYAVTVKVTYGKIKYTITYDLDGGNLVGDATNPTTFYIDTKTFTLNNPTKDEHAFAGWTGTGLEGPTETVTITKGSIGDRSYTATWTENAPAVTTISDVTISGLTAPVKGNALTVLGSLNTETKGATISGITWDPSAETAAASTAYTATVTLTADTGYQFASTVTANAIAGKAAQVTRTDDTHISVSYTFDETVADDEPTTNYTLTTNIVGNGTVTVNDVENTGSYGAGTNLVLKATPSSGSLFLNWSDGTNVLTNAPTYTIESLSANTTLTANFKAIEATVPVILTAGQSNTDGRAQNDSIPYYIKSQGSEYPNVYWSYGNATKDKETGTFDKFWPACDAGDGRWAYDAVVYYHLQKTLNGSDLFVIKESKGNTAINTGCASSNDKWWSADATWLSTATSADADGQSLLLALRDNIDKSLATLADAGKAADIKFLMWHQGEADRSKGGEYQTQLQQVIDYVRQYLVVRTGNSAYSSLPVILGGIKSGTSQYKAEVESAKQSIANGDANIYYVSTDDIPVNGLRADNLHFNAKGAEMLGKKVYDLIATNHLLGEYTYAEKEKSIFRPGISFDETTQKVTITPDTNSDVTGADSYYTLDGTTPTTSSNKYTAAFTITESCTVTANSIGSTGEESCTNQLEISLAPMPVVYDFANTTDNINAEDNTKSRNLWYKDQTSARGFRYVLNGSSKLRVLTYSSTGKFTQGTGLYLNGSNRAFAIEGLSDGDLVRVVHNGTLNDGNYTEKTGISITDNNNQAFTDAITSGQAIKISKSGDLADYAVFLTVSNNLTISQLAINKGIKPQVTFKEQSATAMVYTVTFYEGETLHYTCPGIDGEQTVAYADCNGEKEISVSGNGELVCWTTFGGTDEANKSEVDSRTVALPQVPAVTLKTDGTASKVYTVTFLSGETLHYTLPGKTTEQTVTYDEGSGTKDIEVTANGDFVCWTTIGELVSSTNTTTVSGITINDDVDTGKEDDVYDFRSWTQSMGGTPTLTRSGSDISITGGNKVKMLENPYRTNKEEQFLELHNMFAMSSNCAFNYNKSNEALNGLRTNGDGRKSYLSIRNLKQGDHVTIENGVTVEGKSALRFVSTNAHLKSIGTKPQTDGSTVWESGKTWVMDEDGNLDLILGDDECQAYIYKITITNHETVTPATISVDADDVNKVNMTKGSSDVDGEAKTYYTTDGSVPTASSTELTEPYSEIQTEDKVFRTVTIGSTGKTASSYYGFVYISPTAAVTYDFKKAYENDKTTEDLGISTSNNYTITYLKTDGTDKSNGFKSLTAEPYNSVLSVMGGNGSLVADGLSVEKDRPVAIHNLKKGDVVRIEYSGELIFANSGGHGDGLGDLNKGDVVKNLQAYTITSMDAGSYNYVVFTPTKATTIKQISINQELTPYVMTDFYISPDGDDENAGTESAPLKTLKGAQEKVVSGGSIHIKAGTYTVDNEYMDESNSTWNVVFNLNKDNVTYIGEVDGSGNRPKFDFSSVAAKDGKRVTGFLLTKSKIIIKNIETIGIKTAQVGSTQSEFFRLNGAKECQLINIAAHDGEGIGFYLHGSNTDILIQDCDAYNNADATNNNGENNDGFGAHGSGTGNKFLRCRAWNNADDGFDLKGALGVVTIEECVAYSNGSYNSIKGNGNGIKAGGFGKGAYTNFVSPMHVVKNSIAANNTAAGFYSNHHPGGLQFEGNRAFQNGTDFNMMNRDAASMDVEILENSDSRMQIPGFDHLLTNNISYGNSSISKVVSNLDPAKSTVAGNSFSYDGSAWNNKSYTDGDFVSVDATKLTDTRDAEGNLPATVTNFLKLTTPPASIDEPIVVQKSKDATKTVYTATYPSDATLYYKLPGATTPTTTTEGTVSGGKKSIDITVTTAGELTIWAQKGESVSSIVKQSVSTISNATMTLTDDSRKDRKIYTATFASGQKLYYKRPSVDDAFRSTSSSGTNITIQYNGDLEYYIEETIDGTAYQTEVAKITINNIAMKPTATFNSVSGSESLYKITFSEGTTLYYTLPGGTEQTVTSGSSVEVKVGTTGNMVAYSKNDNVTSDEATIRLYAPTPAVAEDGLYDFTQLNSKLGADYTLGNLAWGDAITVGGVELKKPDAVVAKTLDRFAFTSVYTEGETTTDGKSWMLLNAGRLRGKSSAHDKSFAILNLKKGNYLTLTYSGGAEVKYAGGSATLAEGTEVLTSGTGYEILADGDLLLTVPANAEKNCDITVIRIATTETVSAPTLEERTESGEVVPNKVTLRLGTSSFGKTVTAYYTTDGSNPTTSSTAVTKNGAITVDESCTIKAYCVSETGVASGVTEYTVTLPAASKSASAVYDWLNVVQLGDELAFASDGLTVYNKEYNSTDGWITKQRKDFNAATNFGSKVSVRNGASGLSYDTDKKTIRLTKSMAIHNLGVGDEIVIIYTGDGTLRSAGADEGDAFTINGKTATAGMEIPSGATIKVTKTKYANNYVVVTPSGPTSGKVYISSIYINHEAPTVANKPKAELASVDLDKMTSTYRITFDEGATLFYILEANGSTVTGSNTGTYDLVISEGDKLKAWEVNGTLTSDTLKTAVYAPTPAPSTTGNFDFTEASEELPADIEVTLDASKPVTVGGETLYKPSALTSATFGDKFAFTETGSSNKIRIRTNRQLVFSKGTNMSMGLLNLKKGDVISFDYTGTIDFADPSQVSVETSAIAARATTRAVSSDLESGTAYIVQTDGDILLKLTLTEASVSISKMYIAAAPTTSAAKAIDFATASENYEEVETGSSTNVYVYGKSSAQTFKRLANGSDELPIDGKISTENGSGEITIDGITAANRHIAIHNLAVGDQILVRFYGGSLTFDGHETKGNRVSVNGKVLTAQDALSTGDVIVIDKVDYLNNYVVLKLDSKCSISGIFINRDETEKVWAPTIVESGKNTVVITAGRSSMENEVTTYYTIDGTTPSELNGIGGPYPTYDVELLDGALVEVKAISYSSTGQYSKVTTLVIFADTRTEIIGVPVEEGQVSDIYDLWGRRVETPRPGQIYIINGKKVLYRRK